MTRTESNIVLFSITLCWASSYIFIKNIPSTVSTFAYMTMTSGVASIILAFVFFKKLAKFNRQTLVHSLLLAVILCSNSVFEKLGLSSIPASSAAFVASMNVVFVPLLLFIFRKTVSRNNAVGIVFILAGVALTSGIKPGESFNSGFIIMMLATLCMSVYIIAVDNFSKKDDSLLLGMGQMFFTFLFAFILWLIEEPRTFITVEYTNSLMANIFLLAFFSKAYAYIMLVFTQKYASPVSVTVIAATEPVVTMVLAFMIPKAFGGTEVLTTTKMIGGLFILFGSILAGTDFLSKIKFKRKEGIEV